MAKRQRRSHSSIDKLPQNLRDELTRMIVDGEWPASFPLERRPEGNPRYEDLVVHCSSHGHNISVSAIGRWAMQIRTLARMKQAGVITRQVMADLDDGQASQSQKVVAEMITAVAIEFISDHDSLNAKELTDVAKAMKDCTVIAINSDKYVRARLDEIAAKAQEADKQISSIAAKKQIDPETLKFIKEQIYGIVS